MTGDLFDMFVYLEITSLAPARWSPSASSSAAGGGVQVRRDQYARRPLHHLASPFSMVHLDAQHGGHGGRARDKRIGQPGVSLASVFLLVGSG